MRLIGMLDSPYVRRVAVSLKALDLPFVHESVSVFRHYDHFASINPVVKAPTLVTGAGTILMDSSLILQHVEAIAPRSLMPQDHEKALRLIGLALAACEKSVSIVYERTLRPAEKQHAPWLDRVAGQLRQAYTLLEQEADQDWFTGEPLTQPAITIAVAWRFSQHTVADAVPADGFPRLAALSARAEALAPFRETDFD